LGTADELNAFNIFGAEQPKAALAPWRALQKALLLIEPDGIDAEAP
jgi:hypothetical protein